MNLLPGDPTGSKIRPSVVTLDAGDDDFIGAPITSQSRHSGFDLEIRDWSAAGLNVPSFARLHKLGVLSKRDILRALGRFSEKDLSRFFELLCSTYCPDRR